ncbi:MAG TPA: glutathione S-transferase [Hydrogenophaga sp.]
MSLPLAQAGAARPVLYSFRRCPYAIRARMALLAAGVGVALREVVLRNKPQALLDASPKGTVPVLVLPDGTVIDESLAIMQWALARNDPLHWLDGVQAPDMQAWLALNDGPFKQALDAYKYPERHPAASAQAHRAQGEAVLIAPLEQCLGGQPFLGGARPNLVDAAIFPFVRQWAAVDAAWFASSPWAAVRGWLNHWLESPDFLGVMPKWAPWADGAPAVLFPQ